MRKREREREREIGRERYEDKERDREIAIYYYNQRVYQNVEHCWYKVITINNKLKLKKYLMLLSKYL
jgi:hypothetical protein